MNFLEFIKPIGSYHINLNIYKILSISIHSFSTHTTPPIPNTHICNQPLNELLKTIGWASKNEHSNSYFWDNCSKAILAYKDSLKGKEIVNVLNSFSKVQQLDENISSQLSRNLVQQLDQCRPSDLIIALKAYSTVGISNLSCVFKIVQRLCENIQQLSPKGLSLMAFYLSKLELLESLAGETILRESLKILHTFKDTELLILADAFQHISNSAKYTILFEMIFYEITKRLDLVDISTAFKSFNIISQVYIPQREILQKWRKYFEAKIYEFNEEEISMIIKSMSFIDLKLIETMKTETAEAYRESLGLYYGFLTSSLAQYPLRISRMLQVHLNLNNLKIYDKNLESILYHQFYSYINEAPIEECLNMITDLEAATDTQSRNLTNQILHTIFKRLDEMSLSLLIRCFDSLVQSKHKEGLKYFIFLFLNSFENIHFLLDEYSDPISSPKQCSELFLAESGYIKYFEMAKCLPSFRFSASHVLLLSYIIKKRFLSSDDFTQFILEDKNPDEIISGTDFHSRPTENNSSHNFHIRTFCEFLFHFDKNCKPHHFLEALSVFPEHPASQKWLEMLLRNVSELPPAFFPLFIKYLFEKRKILLNKLEKKRIIGSQKPTEQKELFPALPELQSISQFEVFIEDTLLKLLFSQNYGSIARSDDKNNLSVVKTNDEVGTSPLVLTQISTPGLSCLLKSISMSQKASPMIITIVSFTTQLIINRTMNYIEAYPGSELEPKLSKALAVGLITHLRYKMEPPPILCKLITHSLKNFSNNDFIPILKSLSLVKSWHDEEDLVEIIRHVQIRIDQFENWKQAQSVEESLLHFGIKMESLI